LRGTYWFGFAVAQICRYQYKSAACIYLKGHTIFFNSSIQTILSRQKVKEQFLNTQHFSYKLTSRTTETHSIGIFPKEEFLINERVT
jgi:hypothetical protein